MAAAGMHVLRRGDVVHLADIKPRSNAHIAWERVRHRQAHWLVECAAEFVSAPSAPRTVDSSSLIAACDARQMGVFFYVYAGTCSIPRASAPGAASGS